MIGLGLRLVLSGGREAVTRFVVLAVAVGLGVGLLLTAVAATHAVTTWNNSHGWMWTGTSSVPPGPATAGIAPLWWQPGSDTFDGQQIDRFYVAATGASSPVPPGISHDPGPGQYYASPALAALLRVTLADELADRYPGRLAGVIGDAGLSSPNSLVIIIGHTPAQLAHTPGQRAGDVDRHGGPGNFGADEPQGLDYMPPDAGIGSISIDFILAVVALAILAPVLIFIATATRLSAARREQRFAAMRLVGATRRQVSLLAATESTVAGVLGVAARFGVFLGCASRSRASRSSASRSSPPSCRSARRTSSRWRSASRWPPPWRRCWRCAGSDLPARRRPPGDAEATPGLADTAAVAASPSSASS